MTPVQFSQKILFNKSNECILREPGDLPGVSIGAHQAKHTTGWPGGYGGKPGTRFPENFRIKDTVALAQVLINRTKLFKNSPPPNSKIEPLRFDITKYKKELDDELYQKLRKVSKKSKPVETVSMNAVFNRSTDSWDIHFFPDFNPCRNNLETL